MKKACLIAFVVSTLISRSLSCGKERWAVKVLTARDEAKVPGFASGTWQPTASFGPCSPSCLRTLQDALFSTGTWFYVQGLGLFSPPTYCGGHLAPPSSQGEHRRNLDPRNRVSSAESTVLQTVSKLFPADAVYRRLFN